MKTLTKDGNFQQLFAFSCFSRWANNNSAILSSNTQIRNHSLTEIYQAKKSQGKHFIYFFLFMFKQNCRSMEENTSHPFRKLWQKLCRQTNKPTKRQTDRPGHREVPSTWAFNKLTYVGFEQI